MHIVLASDQFPPFPLGGVGARVTDLARGLVREGHAVTVAGVYPRNRGITRLIDESVEGVRVLRIPPAPQWMRWRPGALWDRYLLSSHLCRLHKQTPIDLVEFTDGLGQGFFGAPPRVPMALRIEGSLKLFNDQMGVVGDPFTYWMEKRALKRAHFLSATSRYAGCETLKTFRLEHRRYSVIYNAIDADLFCPGSEPADPGLIVFVNSIEPRKGVQELMVAMNDICPRYPHSRLVLIGSDTQPPVNGRSYSESLLDKVKPEFRDRIHFAGRLDRYTGVLEYLRKAAVCCYPSRVESFGIAPLEAMAVGKPVIYCSGGPGPELIEDGVSGLLCQPDAPHAIADRIKRIFDDPAFARSLGQRARERALRLFDKGPWIQRNLEYYRQCVASHRNGA